MDPNTTAFRECMEPRIANIDMPLGLSLVCGVFPRRENGSFSLQRQIYEALGFQDWHIAADHDRPC